jgi:periplasmic copper chaperone A
VFARRRTTKREEQTSLHAGAVRSSGFECAAKAAKRAGSARPIFLSRHDVMAAIASGSGRNQVWQRSQSRPIDSLPAVLSSVSMSIGVDGMTAIFRVMLVSVSAAVFAASGATAHEYKVGALDIGHPWSRPTPKDASIAGGYLTITNKGKVADRLIGGASPAASQIEVHEMADVDGVTKTRALANGLEIKPGKTIELKPGSYRILLLGLKEPFQLGQKVKGTLVFEKAGPVEIVYNIEENAGAAVSGVNGAHKHH